MTGKKALILCGLLALIMCASCTFEARGIPVAKYKDTVLATQVSEAERRQMLEEIRAMSTVQENSVFTEKRGIPEYIIGPGDILTINFWEGPKVNTYDAIVRPDGKISYSFVDNLTVIGFTANEVREILISELKRYIRQPRLEVIVKEYKSKSALLFGQINILQQGVSGPGKYPLKGKVSVLDLIVIAGGPTMGRGAGVTGMSASNVVATSVGAMSIPESGNADLRKVELVRRGRKYTLNLYDAMFRGDVSQNVIVDNGDIVTVPELPTFGERIYVFGEVRTQGIYRLKDASDLLAAVSISGGMTQIAIKSDIKIIREYVERGGKPLIISADMDELLKRGDMSQNVALKNGDVVYVPRRTIGDINEFITNTVPLLDYLFYPGRYRDYYFDPNSHLRIRSLQ
ncbi:MAG: polysaccharide biosynthesis/export family protein [Syntrophales bacterium]|nr:polysaccharide biosynthesis/export family protein [Syntrophales bacterium]MDD5233222.1 polysaccharide biosynthesis/export family protein [Syntrophales bacterium]MDD5531901.1 polysaccharide biosynthesis/export family protein [Syntrophales bacterium]